MVQKMFEIRETKNGPKLVNCCKPEQMGTKEFGKMMKRIQTLEEGRVSAKEAKNWRIDGEKKRITRKRREEERRKKKTKRGQSKEDVRVVFL